MGSRSSGGKGRIWKRTFAEKMARRKHVLAEWTFNAALAGLLIAAVWWLGVHDKNVLHPGPVYVGAGSTSAAYAR